MGVWKYWNEGGRVDYAQLGRGNGNPALCEEPRRAKHRTDDFVLLPSRASERVSVELELMRAVGKRGELSRVDRMHFDDSYRFGSRRNARSGKQRQRKPAHDCSKPQSTSSTR